MKVLLTLLFLLMVPSSPRAEAISCKIDSTFNFGSFTSENIRIISSICNLYADALYQRYKITPTITLTHHPSDNAEYDFSMVNAPHMIFYIGSSYEETASTAFTVCHEIGHGLATGKELRFTKRQIREAHHGNIQESSVREAFARPRSYSEGEADYFAIQCLKRTLSSQVLPEEYKFSKNIPDEVSQACLNASNPHECQMILFAAELALDHRSSAVNRVNLFKHQPARLFQTVRHPNLACRLETAKSAYFNLGKPFCWKGLIH